MRLDELFDSMTQRVDQERQRILDDARASAAAIAEEAQRAVEARREAAFEEVRREAAAQLDEARERALAHAAQDELAAQQEVVETLLEQVRGALVHVAEGADFGETLLALLQEALREAPAAAVVLVPPAHLERCRAGLRDAGFPEIILKASPTLKDGVILEDARGTFRVTNTLTGRYERLKPELRRICLRHLLETCAG